MALAELHNITAGYGGRAILRGLNLTLSPGSFHYLMGPSGAGKSTLLRLLYLGLRPQTGRVNLFGRDMIGLSRTDRSLVRRRIGVIFQDYRLLPQLTVFDNVALPLRIAGRAESLIASHIEELLAWVGLGDKLHVLPPSLSGGEQQRVAIARAVIGQPDLLLADEPTGNVDDAMADRLLFLLTELHRSGTTLLVATHNPALISRFPFPCLTLADGIIRGSGQP